MEGRGIEIIYGVFPRSTKPPTPHALEGTFTYQGRRAFLDYVFILESLCTFVALAETTSTKYKDVLLRLRRTLRGQMTSQP